MVRVAKVAVIALVAVIVFAAGCAQRKVRRIGMVIGIKPEKIAEYKELHADSNPGVRDLLSASNMRNFSIYMHQLDDGRYYLFGYYEYVGNDYEADMTKLNANPRNKEWLAVTGKCQIPLKGEKSWAIMGEVYHND